MSIKPARFSQNARLCSSDCAGRGSGFRWRRVLPIFVLLFLSGFAFAQPPTGAARIDNRIPTPSPESLAKADALIAGIQGLELPLEVDENRSVLIRTRVPVVRFSVTDPEVAEITQFSPTEFELIGLRAGQTALTLWFIDNQSLRYLVDVVRDRQAAAEYGELQAKINEMFPNSMVQLIPFADKLIVRGQARDAREAAQILSIVGGHAVDQAGHIMGPGYFPNVGPSPAAVSGAGVSPTDIARGLPASNVINLLDVPGEQQVMLKVRVAELTRTALRKMGSDFNVFTGDFTLLSPFGIGSAFTAILTTDDVLLALQAMSSTSYSKILAEPNLVTLNGRPANFIAGGEFAVPTVVGLDGVGAASTSFRGFGTLVTFTPTILDKDRIRLEVAPSISTINQDIAVNEIPGLNTRAAFTTVDLREGQWLAIAGLLQDEQVGSKAQVPLAGDIPLLNMFFSRKEVKREETEVVILVSPEIIRPMEPHEAPLILPGMEVTEPGDCAFYFGGSIEGKPGCDHRSTVWPVQKNRILEATHRAMIEAKQRPCYQQCEKYYVHGPQGFTR